MIEDTLASIASLPWQVLLLPKMRLRFSISRPPTWLVFLALFGTYFLVMAGILYDLIVEPPSIGSSRDERGNVRPMVFLQYRINGQFIIEGLAASAMFCLGACGFILLDKANKPNLEKLNRNVMLGAGLVLVIVTYLLSISFLKMKVPGYLRMTQ